MSHTANFDLIVLGGGPAGMTAAIYAKRANLNVALLEMDITGGLVNSTYTVENFPSYPFIHGMELMENFRSNVDSLEICVEELFEITELNIAGREKIVRSDDTTYTAPAIILATGRQPIELDVPTQCEQVHFCAICDGSPYKGKRVLVVGGGNSAFDESLYLLKVGVEHITLVESMPRYFASQSTQDELFSSNRVDGFTSTNVQDLIVKDNILTDVILKNTSNGEIKTISVDGIFVFLGQKPNNFFFKDDIDLTKEGYIKNSNDMGTNVPGVFSAGDINEKLYRQITTAISDGTIAALSAERYLREN